MSAYEQVYEALHVLDDDLDPAAIIECLRDSRLKEAIGEVFAGQEVRLQAQRAEMAQGRADYLAQCLSDVVSVLNTAWNGQVNTWSEVDDLDSSLYQRTKRGVQRALYYVGGAPAPQDGEVFDVECWYSSHLSTVTPDKCVVHLHQVDDVIYLRGCSKVDDISSVIYQLAETAGLIEDADDDRR